MCLFTCLFVLGITPELVLSYVERERVPQSWSTVADGVRKLFVSFVNMKSGDIKELTFLAATLSISE